MIPTETILGLMLSCTVQKDPGLWRRPPAGELKTHTPLELECWVLKIEQALELPVGILKTPGRKHGLHSLSDLRAAATLYLTQILQISQCDLARTLGLKRHSSLQRAMANGRRYLELRDPRFMFYYELVQSVAV